MSGGHNVLHVAALNGKGNVTQVCLKYGADATAVDANGKTANELLGNTTADDGGKAGPCCLQ